jgi:hypothetical protein
MPVRDSVRVAEINRLHEEIGKNSFPKALRIGALLVEQKALLEHGDWGPWMDANLRFSRRTATTYMKYHNWRDFLKSENVSDMLTANEVIREAEGKGRQGGNRGRKVPASSPTAENVFAYDLELSAEDNKKLKELQSTKYKTKEAVEAICLAIREAYAGMEVNDD